MMDATKDSCTSELINEKELLEILNNVNILEEELELDDIEVTSKDIKEIKKQVFKNIKINKKQNTIIKRITIAAASISFVFTVGAINPALAEKLPIIGSIFKVIEKNVESPADYSKYAASLNEVVSDNGIKVTLSDILCDGEGLYVAYKVESKESFKYELNGNEPLDSDQLLENEAYHKVNFSDNELVMGKVSGLDGKFIDEHTFIGMKKYYLNSLGKEIPDNFDFEVKITSLTIPVFYNNPKNQIFNGNWAFKVPVKVDKSISKNIDINYKTDNGFSIDSIKVTPFSVVINSTNPDNEHYNMKVIDDKNRNLKPDSGRSLDGNKKINYFGALSKDCKSLRVIIYKDKLEQKETIKNSDDGYEEVGDSILLDKTISIE
ncbi:DUF4179 domain-containing protein [Clostridium beijerinckii]|uniref:DUF4179 domain-containing protein n=1 Tax=Clostridium beijerinckii TaxID=1520 RepID=UPI001FA74C2B|nr:DUF4179 domain-containing protein [Clostridium beijerinckii]